MVCYDVRNEHTDRTVTLSPPPPNQRAAFATTIRASHIILLLVLGAALIGAISLARQPAIVPPPPPPPPAWAVAGHDAARTGHSLSYPVRLPITLVWSRTIPAVERAAVVDGSGTAYLAQPEGSLLALAPKGDTIWCHAMQPITDTSCAGQPLPVNSGPPPPPVAPNIIVGPDANIYAVGTRGVLRAFDPANGNVLMHAFVNFVPADGVVFGAGTGTLYGVTPVATKRGSPAFAVAAVMWKGRAAPGWRRTPIPSRGLTPLSVAPDGTLLVAAESAQPGDPAALYALGPHGAIRWRLPLVPGRPSTVSVEGGAGDWVAWVAVAGARRSWVVAADREGRALWRWSTGHTLAVASGGVALAHPRRQQPAHSGLGYVGSAVGVYGLDLARHHAWLFFTTRASGPVEAPITDVQDTVYVATANGHIYDVWPDDGRRIRWHYDTGRTAPGPLALYPDGSLLVLTHDASGAIVAERLGSGGAPLATMTGLACADSDCPTATPTPTPRASVTATVPLGTPTAMPTTPLAG